MSDTDKGPEFGWFTGVFTPTLLTIVGVILYVRLGWVVGNAGLGGALLIIGIALVITICTGLSLSSIATNTRIGHGGPYALITKSLGYEVGGSVGIPLYLTRPLGVAMYIFGFREGWMWVFPNHSPMAIDLAVFAMLFAIAFASADLAFRVQYFIMIIIGGSLLMIALSPLTFSPVATPTMFGDYPGFPEDGLQGATFWEVFAVFFPATTGILAGANMSGDLKDPRRAIPLGNLWAIAVSSVIYVAVAVWCARFGTPEQLVSNYTFVIDNALFAPLVLAGLLGATFSSALAGLVGGPRILMAMGQHRLLPASDWLAKTSGGEPRNAIMLTGVLTFGCLMFRELNAIAPLVTMFFLITYLVINAVLVIETALGLTSFRPTLQVPIIVPVVGVLGCGFAMFIVNSTFAMIAMVTVVAVYVWIGRLGLAANGEDVRSSMFEAIAEWAAVRVTQMGTDNVRAWKPNLLVPVSRRGKFQDALPLLVDIAQPEGTIKLIGMENDSTVDSLAPIMERLGDDVRTQGVFCTYTTLDTLDYVSGVITALQALQGAFFRPNLLWLNVPDIERYEDFREVVSVAHGMEVGVALLGVHPEKGLGNQKIINVWVTPNIDHDPRAAFGRGNLNLSILLAYRLHETWGATVNLVTAVRQPDDVFAARRFLRQITDLGRIPENGEHLVYVGPIREILSQAPRADLDIFGIQPDPDFEFMARMVHNTRSSCLFLQDSGRESALA